MTVSLRPHAGGVRIDLNIGFIVDVLAEHIRGPAIELLREQKLAIAAAMIPHRNSGEWEEHVAIGLTGLVEVNDAVRRGALAADFAYRDAPGGRQIRRQRVVRDQHHRHCRKNLRSDSP
jgi:hypothetical protein